MVTIKALTVLWGIAVLIAFGSTVVADNSINAINVSDIQQQLPAELANTNLTLDEVKTLVRDKCIEVSGEEQGDKAAKDLEAAVGTGVECITGIVNYTAIQREIEVASPIGELDEVFHKYCRRREEAVQCVETFNSKLKPCLSQDEQENQEVFMRIVRSLLNFVCHKDGDHIALFIAEEGPQCIASKKDEIQECIRTTFSEYAPKEGIASVKTLPKFVLGEQQCEQIHRLEVCIVSNLEKCRETTPSNIVESMFRFIRNETICRNIKKSNK